MDKSLVLKELTIPLTEEQLKHIQDEWDSCEKDGELCGLIAIQPVVFLKEQASDPHIKVSILTAPFSERLAGFISMEAATAQLGVKETPTSGQN